MGEVLPECNGSLEVRRAWSPGREGFAGGGSPSDPRSFAGLTIGFRPDRKGGAPPIGNLGLLERLDFLDGPLVPRRAAGGALERRRDCLAGDLRDKGSADFVGLNEWLTDRRKGAMQAGLGIVPGHLSPR